MAFIKGVAILGAIKYAKSKDFPGGVQALIAGMPPATREVFQERVYRLAWYSYDIYAHLLEAIDREIGQGDLALMDELGQFAGEQDMNGFLKAMASLFSIERSLGQAGYFWGKYCDTGTFTATVTAPGEATAELRGFPDISPGHCHLLTGWLRGVGLALDATTEVVEKTACVHRGDEVCRYRMEWR